MPLHSGGLLRPFLGPFSNVKGRSFGSNLFIGSRTFLLVLQTLASIFFANFLGFLRELSLVSLREKRKLIRLREFKAKFMNPSFGKKEVFNSQQHQGVQNSVTVP